MSDYIACGVCDAGGAFSGSADQALVRSNIRRHKDRRFLVWRCPFCKSLHSKEEVDLAYYYTDYPFHGYEINFLTRLGLRSRLKRLLKAGLEKKHRVLDYGCGSGHFVRYLQSLGFNDASGYDAYSPEYARTELRPGAYDCITCQDVVEHVEDPKAELRAIAGYCRDGGLISVGTPNADSIDLRDNETYLMSLHQPYHRHILSESALVGMAKGIGLKPVAIHRRYYFNFLYPFMNQKFINAYLKRKGNDAEALLSDPVDIRTFLSPPMLYHAFFGYFARQSEMEIIFRRDGR